jgi:hypothetical protein
MKHLVAGVYQVKFTQIKALVSKLALPQQVIDFPYNNYNVYSKNQRKTLSVILLML